MEIRGARYCLAWLPERLLGQGADEHVGERLRDPAAVVRLIVLLEFWIGAHEQHMAKWPKKKRSVVGNRKVHGFFFFELLCLSREPVS